MNRMITDSIMWKEYSQTESIKKAKILEKLIKDNEVVICGYTLAEVLKDIKSKKTFEKLIKGYLVLTYVEIEKEDWLRASKILFMNINLALEEARIKVSPQRRNLKVLQVTEND